MNKMTRINKVHRRQHHHQQLSAYCWRVHGLDTAFVLFWKITLFI